MASVTFDRKLLKNFRRHSGLFAALAIGLLLVSVVTLALTTMWATGPAFFFGQVLFVVLIFAAVSLLVVAAISQDLKSR